MNFDPASKAQDLEKELASLDAEYQNTRRRYLLAIQALRGSAPDTTKEDRNTPIFTAVASATGQSQEPDRPKVVEIAVRDFPGKFTTSQLKKFIDERYPTAGAGMKGSYLSTRLQALRDKGAIKQISAGMNGTPSTWERAA